MNTKKWQWEMGNGKRVEGNAEALDDFFTEAYQKLRKENAGLDQATGINSFADPEIGGAYTISSGGKPNSDKDVWNYH